MWAGNIAEVAQQAVGEERVVTDDAVGEDRVVTDDIFRLNPPNFTHRLRGYVAKRNTLDDKT